MSRRPAGAALAAPLLAIAMLAVPLAVPLVVGMPAGPAAAAAPIGQRCAPPSSTVFRGVPWAQRRLDPERAWLLARGDGVVVAVVDTGVSAAAPALAGRVLPGKDTRAAGPADRDCDGHGTFLAGLIAARRAVGTGFAGLAPGARILPIRVADKKDDVHPDVLAAGILAAVDGGAKVVAVGLSAPFGSPALSQAVSVAIRRQVLVIAPALTNWARPGEVAHPAALPGVVSVMGVDIKGSPPVDVSAYAPRWVSAPGTDLVSVAPAGRGHVVNQGTGLAVGFVAGAAALVSDYRPELPADRIHQRLEQTADPRATRLDALLGHGVVDPTAAVAAALPTGSIEGPPPVPRSVIVIPPRPVADRRPAQVALLWSAVALGGVAVGSVAVAAMVRGRRRGWKAGHCPSAAEQ